MPHVEPPEKEIEPWSSVRRELTAAVSLSVYLSTDLEMPWSDHVYMTDASWMGMGAVVRQAPLSDILKETALSYGRGWIVAMDATYTLCEVDELELKEDVGGASGAEPPLDVRDFVRFARPTRLFLHLYSGPPRPNDLGHYMEQLTADLDFDVVVVPLDVRVDAVRCDLSDP